MPFLDYKEELYIFSRAAIDEFVELKVLLKPEKANQADSNGATLLCYAANYGHRHIVQHLLNENASSLYVIAQGKYLNWYPVHFALDEKKIFTASLLLQDMYAKDGLKTHQEIIKAATNQVLILLDESFYPFPDHNEALIEMKDILLDPLFVNEKILARTLILKWLQGVSDDKFKSLLPSFKSLSSLLHILHPEAIEKNTAQLAVSLKNWWVDTLKNAKHEFYNNPFEMSTQLLKLIQEMTPEDDLKIEKEMITQSLGVNLIDLINQNIALNSHNISELIDFMHSNGYFGFNVITTDDNLCEQNALLVTARLLHSASPKTVCAAKRIIQKLFDIDNALNITYDLNSKRDGRNALWHIAQTYDEDLILQMLAKMKASGATEWDVKCNDGADYRINEESTLFYLLKCLKEDEIVKFIKQSPQVYLASMSYLQPKNTAFILVERHMWQALKLAIPKAIHNGELNWDCFYSKPGYESSYQSSTALAMMIEYGQYELAKNFFDTGKVKILPFEICNNVDPLFLLRAIDYFLELIIKNNQLFYIKSLVHDFSQHKNLHGSIRSAATRGSFCYPENSIVQYTKEITQRLTPYTRTQDIELLVSSHHLFISGLHNNEAFPHLELGQIFKNRNEDEALLILDSYLKINGFNNDAYMALKDLCHGKAQEKLALTKKMFDWGVSGDANIHLKDLIDQKADFLCRDCYMDYPVFYFLFTNPSFHYAAINELIAEKNKLLEPLIQFYKTCMEDNSFDYPDQFKQSIKFLVELAPTDSPSQELQKKYYRAYYKFMFSAKNGNSFLMNFAKCKVESRSQLDQEDLDIIDFFTQGKIMITERAINGCAAILEKFIFLRIKFAVSCLNQDKDENQSALASITTLFEKFCMKDRNVYLSLNVWHLFENMDLVIDHPINLMLYKMMKTVEPQDSLYKKIQLTLGQMIFNKRLSFANEEERYQVLLEHFSRADDIEDAKAFFDMVYHDAEILKLPSLQSYCTLFKEHQQKREQERRRQQQAVMGSSTQPATKEDPMSLDM